MSRGSNELWRPCAALTTLHLRAQLLRQIREFFHQRQVWEVETPILTRHGVSDAHLNSFTTMYHEPGERYGQVRYLHTSPEYAMKRLLAAGSDSIYQLARVFRNEERGRWHNPEFTLLEWYRVGFDHHQLIDEVAALVQRLLQPALGTLAVERIAYAELFQQHLGVDPHRDESTALRDCAVAQGIIPPPDLSLAERDPWLDLLLTHCLQAHLGQAGRMTFLYDYPATQAALARIRPGDPPVAERFELYVQGIELANGFHELNDPQEQRRRFAQDNQQRRLRGQAMLVLDEYFLSSLAYLPPCSGVALGFDRLLMLAASQQQISEVVSFSFERA